MKTRSGLPRTLAQDAYGLLREDIVRGTLAAGAKLRIAKLQADYGIGAIPLREALNRLSAEGMVTKVEQRGFAVPPLDFEAYLDITNTRLVIEDAALRRSIAAADRDWENRLVVAFHHLVKAGPEPGREEDSPGFLLSDAWAETHRVFHMTLVDNCGSAWLLTFARTLYDQSARYRQRRRQLSSRVAPVRANLIREHRDILDACVRRDADTAAQLLTEHYRRSVEIVLGMPIRLGSAPLRLLPPDADGPALANAGG